ncbi:hypothetical protein SAMN04487969_108141 [Paenibacillus algorifonticola]|uniref:Uncharacterized protein n=2 Tax=Paenibacillus algorifonticola TaxID=684063 RepID=A0A1I2E2Y1_9BACL|nr:hypothetical protein SAMN04487969_108141 [Paenibacillus algorifonticola]
MSDRKVDIIFCRDDVLAIYLLGFVDTEDGVADFCPNTRYYYFEVGEKYIEFESINQYSKLSVRIVDSIRYQFEIDEDMLPCKTSVSQIILTDSMSAKNTVKSFVINGIESNDNQQIVCNSLQLNLNNGQELFIDPSFYYGINIGGGEQLYYRRTAQRVVNGEICAVNRGSEMSFILLERERKPIKLRGQKVVPATITALNRNLLLEGEYVGVKSGKKVTIIHIGGSGLIAAPELRDAYSISNTIPATLSEDAVQLDSDEIFVVYERILDVKRYVFEGISMNNFWDDVFYSFWVPSDYYIDNERIGTGWIRISTREIILINGSIPKNEKIQVISTHSISNLKINLILETIIDDKFQV